MTPIDNLRFEADWNRNGLYDHAYADISGYVLSAEISYGFDTPYQMVAPPAQMTILLDNSNGEWNIGRASAKFAGLLQRDVLIRAKWHDGTTQRYIASLKIVAIQLPPGQMGPRVITVVCQDWHADLMSAIYDPALDVSGLTSEAIAAMWATAILPTPYASRWWVMDASPLDTDTLLFNPNILTRPNAGLQTIYQGQTTLDYVGNNLDAQGNGVSALAFLEEMCAAEMDGRFFYFGLNSLPRYIFLNRTALAINYTAVTPIEMTPADFTEGGIEYEYGYNQCNSLELTAYPRKAGSAGTELARASSVFALEGLSSRTMTLRYRDPDNPGGTCTATTIIAPVASTDYTANVENDGSGADMTSYLGIALTNKTNAANVVISNTSTEKIYVTLLKVRGTPLTALQPATLKAVDASSIEQYGLFKQMKTIAGVDDLDLLQQYADYYVRNFSIPRTEFRRVTVDMQNEDTAAAPFLYKQFQNIFFNITITDSWMEDEPAIPRRYWVTGERHVINSHARTWETTWLLEDFLFTGVWKLNSTELSVLDVSTRLHF
jgi:hypothetical protein